MLKISQQEQTLFFAGALDRETVPTQWPFKLLKKLNGTVVFDFSELALVDTAGLAWLLHQVAQATKLGLTYPNASCARAVNFSGAVVRCVGFVAISKRG